MNDAAITAQIVDALVTAANAEAPGAAALVSVSIEKLAPAIEGASEVSVSRKTRTLMFLSAEFRSRDGTLIASASSVHKVTP